MRIVPEKVIGSSEDGGDEPADYIDSLPDFDEEDKIMLHGFRRLLDEYEMHKELDELPDDKEEALKKLVSTLIISPPEYGSENGFGPNRAMDIDEAVAYFVMEVVIEAKPARKPADQIGNSPINFDFVNPDFGRWSKRKGYGFRARVFPAQHDPETGKYMGRKKGITNLYPTMTRAAIASIDVTRKYKQDLFFYD